MKLNKIGIAATSTPGTKLALESANRGKKFFRDKNIELVFADNVLAADDYVAGDASVRMQELYKLMDDPTIDVVCSFWGGHQTHELLPLIEPKLFKMNKPIIGYSDLTPLLNYLASMGYKHAHLGPAFITYCKPISFPYSWENFILSLSGGAFQVKPSQEFTSNLWFKDGLMKVKPNSGWNCFKEGIASGRAMGGNMGALLLTAGTSYWPNLDDCILFLEEDESESIETIDRFLTQFSQIGVFQKVRGVIIGRFAEGVFRSKQDELRLYEKVFKDFKGPVLYDCDFGHTDPLFTIPLGRQLTVNVGQIKSSIHFNEAD